MAGDAGDDGVAAEARGAGRRGLAAAVVALALLPPGATAGTVPGVAAGPAPHVAPRSSTVQARPAGGEAVVAEVDGRAVHLNVVHHRAYPVIDASGLSAVWEEASLSGVFLLARLGGDEVAFEAGSPFFRYGERTYQLANPPYARDGAFWLPAEFVTGWLAARAPSVEVAAPVVPADAVVELPLTGRVDPAVPWRVIIDPGHGGRDPGTLGRVVHEKDIVLSIGRRLYDELRGRDMVEPYLTRNTDVYVAHDLRSQFAVDSAGDLFVSIHANAAADESARGFETIFLGAARSEEAREVALRENRGPEVDGGVSAASDVQFILTGLDRTENLDESRRFAGFVQNSIRAALLGRSPDRGVKQGPWWVLLGALARMPSVIVEVGFLSNRAEEEYLNGAEGQGALARAIADAIVAYREDVLRRYAPAPEESC